MENDFKTAHADAPKPAQRIFVNIGAVVLGAIATFGFIKWQDQQTKIAELADLVAEMQAAPRAAALLPPTTGTPDVVSRNATTDLTALTASVAVPASAPPVELSAAERINAIMAQPDAVAVSSTLPTNPGRLETLAIIEAGIQELAAGVVEGNYDIHTNYDDEDFSGRIHFAFVGNEQDQADFEKFIAVAAERGFIAHSGSVVDSDGSINGHIMLFDLVERSMENGTVAEQQAVAKMQREAVEMLAADVDVGEPLDAQGKQFYVVESGDSLAFIALQFYGNTNDYVRIFQANRSQLNSPERISVGQRLLIPTT